MSDAPETSTNEQKPQITVSGEHLSVVGQSLAQIPDDLGQTYGKEITELDLSYNQIKYAYVPLGFMLKVTIREVQEKQLSGFVRLETLALDNNQLDSAQHWPTLTSLRSLSVNNNNVCFCNG
jgi:hypothetical protein